MKLGNLIDRAIEPFAPATAARRMAQRLRLDAIRKYEAAGMGRRTQGWSRPSTSADAEGAQGIVRLRGAAHDLVRNNKYAAAGVRQLVASIVGDGIAPQFQHPVARVRQRAQDEWDRWAEGRVDGHDDFYGVEKLTARAMVVGGESLNTWHPDAGGPDGRVQGHEGDLLDMAKMSSAPRIVQGVQFGDDGFPAGYWMFDEHPGDLFTTSSLVSRLRPAEHVDHVYERLRWGQTRGVSWLASVAMTLRDVDDLEDAVRLKKKVEALVALILTPGEDGNTSPLTAEVQAQTANKPAVETLRPGHVLRTEKGDQVNTLEPSSSGDGVEFIRQQLAGVAANMVPYHLLTGDVSQANYSSLRAALLGHWAMLDDWQQNVMIPQMVAPAVRRRMRRLALETGDRRYLDLKVGYALPIRRMVDPVKDLMAEIMEIRAGLKLLSRALAERGINAEEHLAAIAQMNDIIDALKLALDIDPRRLTDSGVLQVAAGYLSKKAADPAAA